MTSGACARAWKTLDCSVLTAAAGRARFTGAPAGPKTLTPGSTTTQETRGSRTDENGAYTSSRSAGGAPTCRWAGHDR